MAWRNWRLPVKLAAVMLVPVVFVIGLGVAEIGGHIGAAKRYESVDRRVTLSDDIRTAISAAQQERAVAAVARGGNQSASAQQQAYRPLDNAMAALRNAASTTSDLDAITKTRWSDANLQITKLTSLRSEWTSDPDAAVTGYSDMIAALLGLDHAMAGSGGDPAIVEPATALYSLDAAREEVAKEQALVLIGITRGHMSASEVSAVRNSEVRLATRLADFRSVSDSTEQRTYDQTVSGPEVNRRDLYLQRAIANVSEQAQSNGNQTTADETQLGLSAADWNTSSNDMIGRMRQVSDDLAARLLAKSHALQDSASDAAGTTAVVLFCALVVAVAVVSIMTRQLLGSIRILRHGAHDVADQRLPQAVADIRAGRPVRTGVDPIPVHTEDEVGQLARAFDAVHIQARRLAVEQAATRSTYGNVFVNLSRRSQTLVQRQLRLIERLERDEEDPDRLSSLFQLDHLATRMRRNNENLMVLSGSGAARGSNQQPMALSDLLRAAVSEIEHYQRVIVQVPPPVLVVGYASSDLVRLVAELLDNATAFSSPDTQVTVGTHQPSDGSIVIDIVDHGIGMRVDDLAEANERFAATGTADVPVAKRMGLFVVGRLAERHGIRVKLHGGEEIAGLRASITAPAELIAAVEHDSTTMLPADRDTLPGVPTVGPTLPAPAEPFDAQHSTDRTPDNGKPHAIPEQSVTAADDQPLWPLDPDASPIPEPPDATSSAAGLFTPDGYDDVPDAGSEETPIFDEMVSAWFDTTVHAASASTASRSAEGEAWSFEEQLGANAVSPRWESAADEGWKAVEEVSRKEPEGVTAAGLPKRTPKARLLPGNAGPAADSPARESRDADAVRDRLSSLQRGVQEGRNSGSSASSNGSTSTSASTTVTRGAKKNGGKKNTEQPAAREDQLPSPRWESAADEGWKAVEEVSRKEPEGVTAAGLPKRTPKARLLPGNAGPAADSPARESRDADAVRDRLSRFQRGVQDGRQSVGAANQQEGREAE